MKRKGVPFEPEPLYDLPLETWEIKEYLSTCGRMPGDARDTLRALVLEGPLWDGDVPSKQGRDWLLEEGLISKAVVKGEQGYQVANYKGWTCYCVLISPDFKKL